MKRKHKIEPEVGRTLVLGVVVTVGLILLIIAVYFIGSKKNMFTSTFSVVAAFSDVNGLQEGDAVRFRGINVGTVKTIDPLNDSTIKVLLIFKKKIKPFIMKTAIASIATDGLMGNKIVNIKNQAATGKNIQENDTLKTLKPIDLEDVSRNLKSSNDNLVTITSNLSSITDKINKGKGALGTLITDSVFAKNLKQSAGSLKKGAANIDKESEALKHHFLFRRFFKKHAEGKK